MKLRNFKTWLIGACTAICLCFTLLPATAMAQPGNTYQEAPIISLGTENTVIIDPSKPNIMLYGFDSYYWKFYLPTSSKIKLKAKATNFNNNPDCTYYLYDSNLELIKEWPRWGSKYNEITKYQIIDEDEYATLAPGTYYIRVRKYAENLLETSFTIWSNITNAKIPYSTKTFTGATFKPKVAVKAVGSTLPASAYTVNYSKNTKAGIATVKVTGKGAYTGTIIKNFTIKPAKVTGVKATSTSSGTVKVSWSNKLGKKASVTGYKIVITDPSESSWWNTETVYVKGSSKSTKKIKVGSFSGDKVKVKVYAYKTVNGTDILSAASKTVKVRVRE